MMMVIIIVVCVFFPFYKQRNRDYGSS